ncbi:MAG: glycosyltransferase family 2 protein [Bacteroidota bacterium]|nr:glycosyltransferase family 2 protein [Bacteroidota bacterium]
MAAKNSGPFIRTAIESIISQSYRQLELIIVNDGSTDNTEEEILQFGDERLIYISNKQTVGNETSRNIAWNHAKGKYIALMDSDDRCHPRRLEWQLEYLKKNEKIAGVGSYMTLWMAEKKFTEKYAASPAYIEAQMFYKFAMPHAPCMFRKVEFDRLDQLYDPKWTMMEDYELFWRASRAGLQFSNLKKILYDYRIHPGQESQIFKQERENKLKEFFRSRLKVLDITLIESDLVIFHGFLRKTSSINAHDADRIEEMIWHCIHQNNKLRQFPEKEFDAVSLFQLLRLAKCRYLLTGKKINFPRAALKAIIDTGLSSAYTLLKK